MLWLWTMVTTRSRDWKSIHLNLLSHWLYSTTLTNLFVMPQTNQVHLCLKAFTQATPSTLHKLISNLDMWIKIPLTSDVFAQMYLLLIMDVQTYPICNCNLFLHSSIPITLFHFSHSLSSNIT